MAFSDTTKEFCHIPCEYATQIWSRLFSRPAFLRRGSSLSCLKPRLKVLLPTLLVHVSSLYTRIGGGGGSLLLFGHASRKKPPAVLVVPKPAQPGLWDWCERSSSLNTLFCTKTQASGDLWRPSERPPLPEIGTSETESRTENYCKHPLSKRYLRLSWFSFHVTSTGWTM
jgi:hypothetical protein